MEWLGAPKEIIESLTKSRIIKIMPMNWEIVRWFTQVNDLFMWRADAQCLGLDLTQIRAEAKLSQRDFTLEEFEGLRIMSRAAAREINGIR